MHPNKQMFKFKETKGVFSIKNILHKSTNGLCLKRNQLLQGLIINVGKIISEMHF